MRCSGILNSTDGEARELPTEVLSFNALQNMRGSFLDPYTHKRPPETLQNGVRIELRAIGEGACLNSMRRDAALLFQSGRLPLGCLLFMACEIFFRAAA